MKSYKLKFLEKAVIGRNVEVNNSDEVISKCIKLAYNDMQIVSRYYIKIDRKDFCKKFQNLLHNNNYEFSRSIISETSLIFGKEEKIGNGNKYVTKYGLAQKIVNMTFKYFYVYSEYINKKIDFSKCDCPLDSNILSTLDKTINFWSKITEIEYQNCQNKISNLLNIEQLNDELKQLGNLAYDFLKW